MHAHEHDMSVSMPQVLAWIRGCSTQEKKALLRVLLDDTAAITIASEPSLAKNWDSAEEDEAWTGL